MERRTYLTGLGGAALAGMSGLAGCSALNVTSGDAARDTVEAEVRGQELWAVHRRESGPEDTGAMPLVHVFDEAYFDERIEPRIEATNEDIHTDVEVADLPVPEIAAEIDLVRTFTVLALRLETADRVNGNEPSDEGDYWYRGPTALFDAVGVGETRQFRVAEPRSYYEQDGHGRVIDVLD